MYQKYHNHKSRFRNETFDSKLERDRYLFLQSCEKKGIISDLRKQVWFTLIDSQYKTAVQHLKTKDKEVQVLVEQKCSYVADFVYKVTLTGETVVEDTKGLKTPDYILKRKMMLFFHHIEIREIKTPAEPI